MSSIHLFRILLCFDTLLAGAVLTIFIYYLIKVRTRGAMADL